MREGVIVNYPMVPDPRFVGFQNDMITCFALVTINGSNFMYTGTMDGLVYEWEEIGLQEWVPKRVLINAAGYPIKDMTTIKN